MEDLLFDGSEFATPPKPEPTRIRLTVEGEADQLLALLRKATEVVGPTPSAPPAQVQPRCRKHFTHDEVRAIRRRVAQGEKRSALAKEYGVLPQTISNIVNRASFADVE